MLNYGILPLSAAYLDSGNFTAAGRFKDALIAQIPLVVGGIIAGAGFMCIILFTSYGKSLAESSSSGFVGVL